MATRGRRDERRARRSGRQAVCGAPLSGLTRKPKYAPWWTISTKAFDKRIDALQWMTPETKAKAKEKVKTLYVGVGYPDKWIDYSALEIAKGTPSVISSAPSCSNIVASSRS